MHDQRSAPSTEPVTVIIPTHNRQQLLMRTLHSVLQQRGVNLEVVVVDDGGSDGTADAIAGLGDDRISIIRHETSRGVSAARNTGIARARSRWLAFVDDDDLWAPCKLRAQLDALAADQTAAWSCTGSVNIDVGCRVTNWALPPLEPDIGDLLLRRNVVPGGGSGVLVSRELAVEVGGYDEAFSNLADWDFYIRLALQSRLAPVFRPHLGYYLHAQGMAHDVARSMREHRELLTKHQGQRRERDVEIQRSDSEIWLLYLAGLAYRGGRRWTGVRLHAELVARYRRWYSVRSMALGLMSQRARVARLSRLSTTAPAGWDEEAAAWLAPYAHGWLDEQTPPLTERVSAGLVETPDRHR